MTIPAGLPADVRSRFPVAPGYLDAASIGLPPIATAAAMRAAVEEWQAGRATPAGYDQAVERARRAYARLVSVGADRVAVGPQVSVLTGLVAAALPDGAEVVTVSGDFASVVFPLLVHADRGVRVRQVPLADLPAAVGPATALVAFSLVQSADGMIADAPAVLAAAREAGAITYCDLTQAAGWLPVRAGDFDVTSCGTYKWLCSPRGTAFLTVHPDVAARLRPIYAGWYAGESVWDSIYGPDMRLAGDARRFDVSPAWLSWVGTVPALELFAALDIAAVREHDAGLADAVRAGLDLPPAGRAIVSLPDGDGQLQARLRAAGCQVSGRAGRVRLSFHLWNDEADVDLALGALRGGPAGA